MKEVCLQKSLTKNNLTESMEISDTRKLTDAVQCALDLKRQVVGVNLLNCQSDYDQSTEVPPNGEVSFCTMVKIATKGRALKIKQEHIKCPGATRALGLTEPETEFLTGERYFSFDLYETLKIAKATTDTATIIPRKVLGIIAKPLALYEVSPDIVLIICNPMPLT